MAQKTEPSYTDLVYEVLRSAPRPLTFPEIFDAVSRHRPIATKNPKATIRNVLGQGPQLISLGDGHYGYLPHLIEGSLLRLPLTEKKPANHPLTFPDEVRHALWPSFFEAEKRKLTRPVVLRLPSGVEVALSLEGVGEHRGSWGSPMPEGLRRYLVENYAAAGDSLLLRVTDGEAGRGELAYEPRRKQDAAAVERRNQELADAAERLLRRVVDRGTFIWEIVIALLARGFYHADVAPDPLETILKVDRRFADAGWDSWMLAERLTPEVEADIRRRKDLLQGLFGSLPEDVADVGEAPSAQAMRRAMERSFADVGALLDQQEFGSLDEANAFLQKVMASGGVPRRVAETPLEKAQDLMYEAWEAPRHQDRIRLAREALRVSPDCADAYVLLAEETAHGPKEAAEIYAQGVAAGERALGKEAFAEDAGHFWGIIETRPYMRARLGLAQAQWAMGKRREAIEHAWEMLRLNPGDNQGVRDVLLNWLLQIDEPAQVETLFDRYPDEGTAVWLYARALHAFRREGDTKHAQQLLAEAKAENVHVPDFLQGKKRLPHLLPEAVGFGDENEAIYCAVEQLAAWRKTPGALAWLGTPGQRKR